jgi:methyltransferase (TIGR00027 family)
VRYFELDHAATQQDKARRAPGPGPTYVEADLRIEFAAQALLEAGVEAARPALFVLEGLTMYLDEEVVRRQLGELGKTSAPGSRLAVDFVPPRQAGTSVNHRQNRLQRLARAGSGETFKLTLGRPEAVGLVTAAGWDVSEQTSMRDAARALVPPGSGLPVDAVNDHKTLLAASRS